MAISSLSKFTVPLASDQSASTQGLLMPKLKYRFRINFENFGTSTPTTELTKQVQDAGRPKVTFENKVIDVYNSKVNLAGKPSWGSIKVVLRDDVSGAVSKLVGEQIQKQFDFFEQSSAASGGDYKFTMRIEMLDGGNGAFAPNVLETWECYGCYLQDVAYGDLKYSTMDPVTIDLTIQVDNCLEVTGGAAPSTTRTALTNATGGGI
jgi:hypothetical protein